MKRIAIFPLSLYVKCNELDAFNGFAKLGIPKWKMFWHYFTLQKIFMRYRKGELSTDQFKKTIRDIFPDEFRSEPGLNELNRKFDSTWNSMLEVTSFTKAAFEEMKQLQQQGVDVYLFGNPNKLHWEYIQKEYGKELPGTHYLSFQKYMFEKELMASLIKDITRDKSVKPQDICLFYYLPSSPNLRKDGILGYLWGKLVNWKARSYVNSIKKIAGSSTTLVQSPYQTSEPIIIQTLGRYWPELLADLSVESKLDTGISSSYTPNRDKSRLQEQQVARKNFGMSESSHIPRKCVIQ